MYEIKKTYKDFFGTERTEVFRFNLMKSEIAEMELSKNGGFAERIQAIIDAKDDAKILAIFKDFVLNSYGEVSEDGKYFMKNDTIRNKFECMQAYSDIFTELAFDSEKAEKFINGIVPEDMRLTDEQIKQLENNKQ